ncbi:hypothetical protein D5F01_LYC22828 [Larimichthys crocea]|uniref:Ubiquitin-like domain-containing protein n=1 Tax=Larimichthys crocea TaxID=215358 RepID=A0A6G0HJN2_LARCR|nr:hypothetical protein D5F01_LYC22828 [Larimichthys crocea]
MVVKVFIIGPDDERLEIDLCDTEEKLKDITVLDLKRRIKDRKGIPELEQVIVFAGKRLKDDRPLSDYGVKDLSTLHMVRQQEPGAGGSDEDGGMGDKKGKNKNYRAADLVLTRSWELVDLMEMVEWVTRMGKTKNGTKSLGLLVNVSKMTDHSLTMESVMGQGLECIFAMFLKRFGNIVELMDLMDLMKMVEWVTRRGKTEVITSGFH